MDGIARKRTLGIAIEATYGVPVLTPLFVMPVLTVPKVDPVITKILNEASLGSTYKSDSVIETKRMANVSGMEIKIDEDQVPVFFMQKFDIQSTALDAGAYQHTLTYNNDNDGTSYTLMIEDPDRGNEYYAGVKVGQIAAIFDTEGFARLQVDFTSRFPETWTGSNVVAQPKEFVGRHATFNYGDATGSKSATGILQAQLNHNFNLSGDDVNFELGNNEPVKIFTGEDEFDAEITAKYTNRNIRDDWDNNTRKQFDITLTDTGRIITDSNTNVNPSVVFEYDAAYLDDWKEDGEKADILRQVFTLRPVDRIGVSDAPLKITVKNHTASY